MPFVCHLKTAVPLARLFKFVIDLIQSYTQWKIENVTLIVLIIRFCVLLF